MLLFEYISEIKTHFPPFCFDTNRYVERLCNNGLLKEGEASEFLEEMQEMLLVLSACPETEHSEDDK